jgi:hypothetical protein
VLVVENAESLKHTMSVPFGVLATVPTWAETLFVERLGGRPLLADGGASEGAHDLQFVELLTILKVLGEDRAGS